ncbi:MAG: sce7726 family protein [Terracidiphilus sp.]
MMMRDRDVRAELHRQLDREHGGDRNTRVLDELGLRHGTRRVDVAVVNGSLHGYEIKSDSDTLARLAGQVEVYSAVLDLATLVVGKRLAVDARKHIPKWWGIKIASEESVGKTVLVDYRAPRLNRQIDPIALAELLWRSEAVELLSYLGATPKILRSPRAVLYQELVSSMPLTQLREAVRTCLKMRTGWRDRIPPLSDACLLQPTPMC